MSDNHDFLRTGGNGRDRLRADALVLTMRGAGYAALFCVVIGFAIAGLYWVGKMLPEDSRFTPDPTPFSFYQIESDIALV